MRKFLPIIFIILGSMTVIAGGFYFVNSLAGRPEPKERVEKSEERLGEKPKVVQASAEAPMGGPLVSASPNAPTQFASVDETPAASGVAENRSAGGAILNKFDAAALSDGSALVVQKKFPEALARLKPIEPVAAGNLEFDIAYGIALLETGNAKEATVPLRRALNTDPNNMLARTQLARALSASGQLDAAKKEIEIIRAREDLNPEVRATMDKNSKTLGDAIERRDTVRRVRVAQAGSVSGPEGSTVKRAAELVRAGKPNEALNLLSPLQSRLGGNPDFDYVYGVALLDVGRPAEAVVFLRRATDQRPDFHVARAEYGRALAAMGDLEGAKREFSRVRDVQGLPAPVRDAMGRQVEIIDSRSAVTSTGGAGQPRTRVTGYIEQSVGYDTNVNSGPSAMTITIPGIPLGSGTLDPTAAPKKAGFYEIAGGLSIAHAIDNQTAFYANMLGNYHALFKNNEFNTALVGGEVGIARQVMDGSVFSLALIGQAFWLDESVYRGIYGVAGQWRKRINDWDVNTALTWIGINYPDNTAMDANRYTVSGGIGRRLEKSPGQPSFLLTVSGGTEITRYSGTDYLSYDFVGIRYSGDYMITPRLIGFIQMGYEYHSHHEDYPLFFTPRKENLYDILLGYEWRATDRISFRPTVRYSRTASNVDLFDTDRWVWSVASRYAF